MESQDKNTTRALARKKKQAPPPAQPDAPPKQASHRAPRSPSYTTLLVLLAVVVNLTVAYWGHQAWVDENRRHQLEERAVEQAQAMAGAIAYRLEDYQKKLEGLANDEETVRALSRGDSEAIAELERQLAEELAAVQAVHALPARATTRGSAERALSFAELDMMARAEKRDEVFPEAVRRDGDWIVNFATPVPADANAPVVGTLLVALPLDALRSALATGNGDLGRIDLLQSFNGRRATELLSIGFGEAGVPQTVDVPDSYWSLRFTPSQQLWQQTRANLSVPLAVLVISFIISLAGAIYLGRRLNKRQQQGRPTAAQSTKASSGASTTASTEANGHETDDILDIVIAEEDEALLGLDDAPQEAAARSPATESAATPVPEVVFRAYDIRGRAESEITPELAHLIGQALGSEALDNSQNALVVARDMRTHSPLLAEHLIAGILSTGCSVVNVGAVPTPLMYFATETLTQTQSGVMVTASHNPAEYNGFKIVMNGNSRSAEDIQNVRKRILAQDFYSGRGTQEHVNVVPNYIDTIFSDVALAGEMHLVLDGSNGVAGTVAPQLFEELGCRVTTIYCEPDGTFPNHAPDPSIADNLQDLIAKVREVQADLGIAFDGDGDRLTVVTAKGEIVWADRLLMLFAKDIVARNPGADVVFDVKSTRLLNSAISSAGGRPIMWKTGHAPMRAKMRETGALLGGEFSGHVFIKDRWYGFDDGIYAAARLVEILSLRGEDLDTALAEFPPVETTPEVLIPVAEEQKFAIVRQLIDTGDFGDARLTTLDGLRADFPRGWGLVRPSNTSANLTLRFEADNQSDLEEIKAMFKRELTKVDASLPVNW